MARPSFLLSLTSLFVGSLVAGASGQASLFTNVLEAASRPYGFAFFAPARTMVDARRGTTVGADSFMGGGVAGAVPERYQLGPGDKLVLSVSSPFMTPADRPVTVDPRGYVRTEGLRAPLLARGLTVGQLESALRNALTQTVRGVRVTVALSELRSIGVQVLGESYAPGAYQMPSTVTLFNALYASGGPSDIGSLRRIGLKRANAPTREFDLYRLLLKGDGSQDVPLQPGDVIFIPPASGRVRVGGEVVRPAIYELKSGERLKDALAFAGGVLPSGIARKVAVTSVRPGAERVLLDVDATGKGLVANPILYAGDGVEVYPIRSELANVATVEGAVTTPRGYAVRAGMRVRDLIESARGLLPEAYAARADLFRQNPDGSSVLLRVDLEKALTGDPAQNVPIRSKDRLVVYRADDVRFSGARRVVSAGALRRPGTFERADGMTLSDLILRSGGLAPDAFLDRAVLRRTSPDGTPGPLVPVDLAALLKGVPSANLPLQDLDEFRVDTLAEASYRPERTVELAGAVQRPKAYPLAEGMKLSDLVRLAGGPLPDAETRAVFVQRANPDGTQGPLLTLDLAKALAGDPANDIALQSRDRVSVFTQKEAAFRIEETVRISGAVQRPGSFPRASNMRLSDLLKLAGGIVPTAAEKLQVAHAFQTVGTPPELYDTVEVLGGRVDPALQPGDVVSLPVRSEVREQPLIVILNGAVKYPGPYIIDGRTMRISDVVARAGGLTIEAFPRGAQFARSPSLLQNEPQKQLAPRILEALRLVSDDEYKRAAALADMDRLRVIFSNGASITTNSAPLLPGAGGTTVIGGNQGFTPGASLDQALAQALRTEAATKARPFTPGDLVPIGNLGVRMENALRRPGSSEDIVLKDGDVLTIPERPTSVTIAGAVVVPSSVVFDGGQGLDYYLQRAGGTTNDAETKSIILVRASGELVRYRPGVKVELGDTIIVPTKAMAVRLAERRSEVDRVAQTVTSAGITVALLRALTR
ncbi:hypothetical protein BH11ARM2_BH11ARM2_06710 [soil metagenome]